MTGVPEHIRGMPLHAITEVYGEAGLRDRFAQEIAGLPQPEQATLVDALELAGWLHRDDRRVREPYVNHLLRVTIRIITYYRVRDPEVLCAALLHDAVEDHAPELADRPAGDDAPEPADRPAVESDRRAALRVLARRFTPRVAELVAAVTNPVYRPDRDRHEQYREHVAQSLAGNPWARVIKLSDFTDNGVGVIHTSGPKVISSAGKYAPLVPVLRRVLELPDTPLPQDVREHIAGQLSLAQQRFSAILGARSTAPAHRAGNG